MPASTALPKQSEQKTPAPTAHNWGEVERQGLGHRIERSGKLAYYFQATDADYWDGVWEQKLTKQRFEAAEAGSLGDFEPAFLSYLPRKRKVLEAGCGLGNLVLALKARGFDSYGVDFGKATVEQISELYPDLPLWVGDVTSLSSVSDGEYGGYISIGVIEHREEGPEPFLKEAYRVLADDGVAIFTTPHFHLLRFIKARLGFYRNRNISELNFYQYAYSEKALRADLESAGFTIVDGYRHNPVKGISDEFKPFRSLLKHRTFGKPIKRAVKQSRILSHLFGHSVLLVCRKTKTIEAVNQELLIGLSSFGQMLQRYFSPWDPLFVSGTRRSETLEYLQTTGFLFHQDRSNASTAHFVVIEKDQNLTNTDYTSYEKVVFIYSNKHLSTYTLRSHLFQSNLVELEQLSFPHSTTVPEFRNLHCIVCRTLDKIERRERQQFKKKIWAGQTKWRELENLALARRSLSKGICSYYVSGPPTRVAAAVTRKQLDSAVKGNLRELAPILMGCLPKTGQILDVGCGNALRLLALKSRGFSVMGSDPDLELSKQVRDFAPGISIQEAKSDGMPFSDTVFEAVIAVNQLDTHDDSEGSILSEIKRVISDDGVIVIQVAHLSLVKRYKLLWFKRGPKLTGESMHHREYTKAALLQKLEQGELYVLESTKLGVLEGMQREVPFLKPRISKLSSQWRKRLSNSRILQALFADQLIVVCQKRTS